MMKRWSIDALGRKHLKLVEAPVPTPGHGEILIRVSAVSLNYLDKMMLETGMGMQLPMPFTPASDVAGTVVAIGPGVTRFKNNDKVLGTFWDGWIDGVAPPNLRHMGGMLPGTLSEYIVLHEDWAVAAPTSVDMAQVSTLPLAALTAWLALVETGGLKAIMRRARIQGIGVGHRRALEDMLRTVDRLSIQPVIDRVYPFHKLQAAHDHLERGAFGKIVIRVSD